MNLLQDQLRGEIHHHDCNYVHPGALLPEPSIHAILSTAPCYHGSSDYIIDLYQRPLPISERLLLLYSVTLQKFSLDTLSIVVERSLALKRLLTSSYFIIRQFKFLIFRTTMKCFQNYFLCFFKRLRINIIFKSVFYFLFCSLFLCIIKN